MFSCYFIDFGRVFVTFEISISKNVNELFDEENVYYFFIKISEKLEITVLISVQTQLQIDLEMIIDVPHHL